LRRPWLGEFQSNARRNEDVAEQDGQEWDSVNHHQVAKWTCICDDDHRGLIAGFVESLFALLPKPLPGFQFLLEVGGRVLVKNVALLKEAVEVVAAEAKKSRQLMFREAMCPVGFDRHVLERDARRIGTGGDDPAGKVVRDVDGKLHSVRVPFGLTVFPALAKKLHRDSRAVAKDVKTLERYGVVRTELKPNPGHGKVKMVEATASSLRFVTTI
jgi:hypothetical protein